MSQLDTDHVDRDVDLLKLTKTVRAIPVEGLYKVRNIPVERL